MHPFSTPWKYEKTLPFSDVFGRGERKGALGTNGLSEKTRVSIKQNPTTVTKSDKSCNIQITFWKE